MRRTGRGQVRRLRIVVTAGPTREYLDSVRFISNASSGKMGYAIAKAARDAGHRVTLISGPVAISPPPGVVVRRVISAAEMLSETKRAFRDADAAIFAAAVSDYRPRRRLTRKGPKVRGGATLALEATEDIAALLGRVKGKRVTLGFALEDHAGRSHAERKLRLKQFDGILLNGPEAIDADRIGVAFFDGRIWEQWPRLAKNGVARRIIRYLQRALA